MTRRRICKREKTDEMDTPMDTFLLDQRPIPFQPGDSVLRAARAAGVDIPHLCFHPEFSAHGSCRVCTVRADGRPVAACTLPAHAGLVVESETEDLRTLRRAVVQMLFAEGNHFCPACEKSGDCQLQTLGYRLGVTTAGFRQVFPDRPVDASHPDMLLDSNRCILCELCVRASREVDGKAVFALGGRGLDKHLLVNAASGRLGDTDFSVDDAAARICPVGALLKKRVGFSVPIGARAVDQGSAP